MSLGDFEPYTGTEKEFSNKFLKRNCAFPIGTTTQKYLWIYCDICGHSVNVYELVSGLWLCQRCATSIKTEERRITAVRCDICNSRLTYCKTKTQQWWECKKCKMITEKTKLK